MWTSLNQATEKIQMTSSRYQNHESWACVAGIRSNRRKKTRLPCPVPRFSEGEKQVSDRWSSSWFRRQSRFARAGPYRQVQRAANPNQQGTEEQGDPAEQGEIDGHAKQQAVRHRAGGLN